MNISSNTVTTIGGATGIGLELAKQFITKSNTAIVCGRRESKLKEAKSLLLQLIKKKDSKYE